MRGWLGYFKSRDSNHTMGLSRVHCKASKWSSSIFHGIRCKTKSHGAPQRMKKRGTRNKQQLGRPSRAQSKILVICCVIDEVNPISAYTVPALEISQPTPHEKALGIINRLPPFKLFMSLPSITLENRPGNY